MLPSLTFRISVMRSIHGKRSSPSSFSHLSISCSPSCLNFCRWQCVKNAMRVNRKCSHKIFTEKKKSSRSIFPELSWTWNMFSRHAVSLPPQKKRIVMRGSSPFWCLWFDRIDISALDLACNVEFTRNLKFRTFYYKTRSVRISYF